MMTELTCPHCEVHIDEHEALRCLDIWIAEVIFEQEKCPIHLMYTCCGRFSGACSTDIAAAWEVVEKFSRWKIYAGGYVMVGDSNDASKEWEAHAQEIPLAICRAAIKATIND